MVTLVEHGFIPKHPPYSRASRPSIMVAHVFQIVQGVRFSTQLPRVKMIKYLLQVRIFITGPTKFNQTMKV